jgi:NADH:ubiquinone reductase (H+-translocating)
MKLKVRGFIAWWVWRSYYLMQMPRFERKLRIVLDWTVALFFHYDIVKLDLFGAQHPLQQRGASAPTAQPSAAASPMPDGASPRPDPPLAA